MNGITDEDDETGQHPQWSGNNPHGTSDFNRNVVTICNNVNNIMGLGNEGEEEEEEEEGTGTLSIMKTISCIIDGDDTLQEACDAITSGNPFLPDTPITPDEFTIDVTGNNPDPSSFEASSTPVEVTIGAGEFKVSEMADASVQAAIDLIKNENDVLVIEGPNVTFSGDCNQQGNSMTADGSIAGGESQTCNIDNAFEVSLTTTPPL